MGFNPIVKVSGGFLASAGTPSAFNATPQAVGGFAAIVNGQSAFLATIAGTGIKGDQGEPGPAGLDSAVAPLYLVGGVLSIDLSAYYLASNPAGYITISALAGYATQSWVQSQGYLTSAPVTSVAGRTGAITLSAADISGLGSMATETAADYLTKAGNLSGLASISTARANLGLGSAATASTGDFAAAVHTHAIADVTGLQTALDGKAALSHTHTANQISDSTTAGRALLTAADAASQRTSLGLGTMALEAASSYYLASNPSGFITSSALTPYLLSATASTTYAPIAAGLPTGGTAGQALVKVNGTDYNATWTTLQLGDRYLTTSTTSLTISNGSKSLTVGTGLAYSVQQAVIIAYDGSNHMHGTVTSYNSGTGAMVVNISGKTGSGTYSSWTVNVGGITSLPVWGDIGGTLSNQTDLQSALDAKLAVTTAASTYYPLTNPSGYVTASTAPVTSVAGKTGAVTLAVADVSGAAPTASPTFTGDPKAPTPATSDNDTSIATTAFVNAYCPTASTSTAGKVQLATDAEAIAGTDADKAVTASGLDYAMLNQVTWDITANGSSSATTSGTGAQASNINAFSKQTVGPTSAVGYANLRWGILGHTVGKGWNSSFDFSRKYKASVMFGRINGTDANSVGWITVGDGGTIVNNAEPNDQSFGFKVVGSTAYGFVHNGSSLTVSTSSLSGMGNGTFYAATAVSDGFGNVTFNIGGVSFTMTGGPTGIPVTSYRNALSMKVINSTTLTGSALSLVVTKFVVRSY